MLKETRLKKNFYKLACHKIFTVSLGWKHAGCEKKSLKEL